MDDFCTGTGSSQGQNLALASSCISSLFVERDLFPPEVTFLLRSTLEAIDPVPISGPRWARNRNSLGISGGWYGDLFQTSLGYYGVVWCSVE